MRRLRVIEGRKNRGLSGVGGLTSVQASSIRAVINEYGPAMGALSVDTLMAISANDVHRSGNWPYDVAEIPASIRPLLPAMYKEAYSLLPGQTGLFGGLYGYAPGLFNGMWTVGPLNAFYSDLNNFLTAYYANDRNVTDVPPTLPNGQRVDELGWINDPFNQNIGATLRENTYAWCPPIADINAYVNLFAPLSGNIQLMAQTWGMKSPGVTFNFPDPMQIKYDPRVGLYSPLSNAIQPAIQDESVFVGFIKTVGQFVLYAVALYSALSGGAQLLATAESLGTTAAATAGAVETSAVSTELSTAAEEAMREYALADSLGATITQGEANAWIAAIENAGLSVPESLISTAATAPASGTGTSFQYESAPQPDIDLSNAPTNTGSSSGSTPNASTSPLQPNPEANVQYEPPQAPTTPNASGSSWTDSFLKQGSQTLIKSALAPAGAGLVATGSRTGTMQPRAPDYLATTNGGTDIMMTTDSTHTATVASRRHFPWWLLAVGAAVIYKVGRKSHG